MRLITQEPAYAPEGTGPAQARGRLFANFTVYKGKAAMALKVIKPSWQATPDGDYRLARAGTVLLELAPVVSGGGSQPGERRYNWADGKQTFALSAVELGALIDPPPEGIKDMFHDPNMGSSGSGQVTKSLAFKPMPNEPGGWFLSLSVREGRAQQTSLGVPVSRAEFAVMRALANHIIPYLLGWSEMMVQTPNIISGAAGPESGGGPPF